MPFMLKLLKNQKLKPNNFKFSSLFFIGKRYFFTFYLILLNSRLYFLFKSLYSYNMKPTLLVLAAGMGSRYGGLKQLDGVGPAGETIMEFSIYDAIKAGFGKVVFVIRESFEQDFKERFENLFEDQIEIAYAFQHVNVTVNGIEDMPERTKPWGTAHAVLALSIQWSVIN